MRSIPIFVCAVCALAACAAPVEITDSASTQENGATEEYLREAVTDQALDVGEAIRGASTAGDLCAVNCAAGYAALCYYVSSVCPAASVVTIGGAVVPCTTAIAVACIGGAAVGAICARRCPP